MNLNPIPGAPPGGNKLILPLFHEDLCSIVLKHKNDVYQTSDSYSPAARNSIQKFDDDCDVIFTFKM